MHFVGSDYLKELANYSNPVKNRTFTLMNLSENSNVLDVGCGPGVDTIFLGKSVVTKGSITGIDFDHAMISEANHKSMMEGLFPRISHQQASSLNLPFRDRSFDTVRSERMLQHIKDPLTAICEMSRVCKSKGKIVIADSDHSSMSIDTNEIDTEWKLRRFRTDYLPNGYSGRSLFGQCKKVGLIQIETETHTLVVENYRLYRYMACMDIIEDAAVEQGIITNEDLNRYNRDLEAADRAGLFWAYCTIVIVSATRP